MLINSGNQHYSIIKRIRESKIRKGRPLKNIVGEKRIKERKYSGKGEKNLNRRKQKQNLNYTFASKNIKICLINDEANTLQCVSRKGFGSAYSDTIYSIYTIYLSLCIE